MEEFSENLDLDGEFDDDGFDDGFKGGGDFDAAFADAEFNGEFERRGVVPEDPENPENPEDMAERRQHTRYPVDAVVEVLVADGSLLFRGRVLDLSLAGCYVETEARLRMEQGTVVEMVFRVKNAVFRMIAASKKVRPGQGAGFLFLKMNQKMRAELDALIAELARSSRIAAEVEAFSGDRARLRA